MSLQLLKGKSVYLAGAMTEEEDFGKGWRNDIKQDLKQFGLKVNDPTSKAGKYKYSLSQLNDKQDRLHQIKEQGNFDEYTKENKKIRNVCLAMVDNSDFLISKYSICKTYGTWEEVFWANRCRKPILLYVEHDSIKEVSGWIFATLPWRTFFTEKQEIIEYLTEIHENGPANDDPNIDRWML